MRRALLALAALLAALPALALGAAWLLLDGEALKPRVVEAVERATGEPLALARLALRPVSLAPVLVAERVVLGAAEQPLATLRRAEVSLALLPLLAGRVELRRIAAEGVVLHPDAPRAARPAPLATAGPAPDGRGGRGREVALGALDLADVTVHVGGGAWHLARATVTPDGAMAARVTVAGQAIDITGRVPPGMLADGPVSLRAVLPGGAVASVAGERRGSGFAGRATADVPALAALSPLAGVPLPALAQVAASVEFAWDGALRVARAEVSAGPSRIGALAFEELRASAEGDAPMRLSARGEGVSLSGTGPGLPALLGRGALSVDVALILPGGEARIAGTLPVPGRPAGALEASGRLADAAALGGPPGLRDLRFAGRATPEGGDAWRLAGVSIESAAGDLAAELLVRTAPRIGVSGRVTSGRLDLDALREAPASGPPGGPPPSGAPPSGPPPSGPPPSAPPPSGPSPQRLIPDTPLPLAALRGFDADVTFALAELRTGDRAIRAAEGRFVNQAGRARLDPFAATPPGGRLALRAAADATLPAPAVQVAGGGEGLDLAALLPGAGVAGRADLQLDLRGQGDTVRAVAATLTGRLGLAVTDGSLDAGLTRGLLAGLPQAMGGAAMGGAAMGGTAMGRAPRDGALALACLALLAEADRGVVRPRAALLDTSLGRIAADGQLDLRDEALALRLATDLRVAGLRVRAPVPLTGTLAAPRLDWSEAARSALSGEVGQQAERLLPGLGPALGPALGQVLRQAPGVAAGQPAIPECGAALTQARFGRAGPVPRAPAAMPAPTPAPPVAPPGAPPVAPAVVPPAMEQLLRGLLGR